MNYKKMFDEAKAELEALQRQKADTEDHLAGIIDQIDAMTQTANAIAPLIGEVLIPTLRDQFTSAGPDVLKAAGITVAVRMVLDANPDSDFAAPNIRDSLQKKGWDWSEYKNPLSTIHTTLRRLVESGGAKSYNYPDGKRYRSAKEKPKGYSAGGSIDAGDIYKSAVMISGLIPPIKIK